MIIFNQKCIDINHQSRIRYLIAQHRIRAAKRSLQAAQRAGCRSDSAADISHN